MPQFREVQPEEVVHCTNKACADKPAWIRYQENWIVLKPNGNDRRAYRARNRRVRWYCCNCNNLIAEKEIPANAIVDGIPQLENR